MLISCSSLVTALRSQTRFVLSCAVLLGYELGISAAEDAQLQATHYWRYHAPSGACEIAAYSAETGRLFVTVGSGVDVVSVRNGMRLDEISIPAGFHATSVACSEEVVAVAWAADDKTRRGKINFYDAEKLNEIAGYPAGFLPDMIVFTPNGKTLLAANEAEPDLHYTFDPEASISIITKSGGWANAKVREATFKDFNPERTRLIADGVRIFGPNKKDPEGIATVAKDVEPEYIAVRGDSRVAWVTLQENNAIAELDIDTGKVTAIYPLGLKSFRSLGSLSVAQLVSLSTTTGLDVSDQDGGVRIRHWPIWGMYQPDGIATFQEHGNDYLVTANEGDPRDYWDYHEAIPVGELAAAGIELDSANPARGLTGVDQLGRLEVSRFAGDTDGDGDLDRLVIPGTRSFSIWQRTPSGLMQVFDSGSEFEQIIARLAPELFNIDSNLESGPDVRSVIRGAEPENIVVFELERRRLAAIGLERTGGVMLYDISSPITPSFLYYISPKAGDTRDLAPEGLLFISADRNPSGQPLLVLCNEGSGTMTAYEVSLSQ